MKNIKKQYLEKEIKEIEKINKTLNFAAGNSPFGNSINLKEEAEKYLENTENRIRVQIYQKHRISVLESLLKELSD